MTERLKKQIMAIRDSGETNMLDIYTVQYIANQRGYYELVIFIEENCKKYINFILTGEEEYLLTRNQTATEEEHIH